MAEWWLFLFNVAANVIGFYYLLVIFALLLCPNTYQKKYRGYDTTSDLVWVMIAFTCILYAIGLFLH